MTDCEQEQVLDAAVDAAGDGADIARTVGEVSTLLGVSVRALHHWDETGLVRPSQRSDAGYRLYSETDIMRIQQVLVYRQTGMSLADIKTVLDDPKADAVAHLRRQRDLLQGQVSHLQHMLRSIDTVMEIQLLGAHLSVAEMVEIWGTDWDPVYIEEAQAQWGDTQEWAESSRRKARMSRADWEQAHEETVALERCSAASSRAAPRPMPWLGGTARTSTGGSRSLSPSRYSSVADTSPMSASHVTTTSVRRGWPPGSRTSSTPAPGLRASTLTLLPGSR